jgi:ABC-type lipoprotein release transport system permease subunit
VVGVAVLAVVIVNLLTLVPSRDASRVRPAEALRCE